ncbi:Putative metal-dependent hydrolase, composite domain superfamily [Colletotrichum destructivum]|uniref:Metal-dependent hydrolase, composite domain superfamily n=1 Tax=Colletotrichum destructivum TaxID=34406 RepID=A0AAX4IIY4_9PEZI|nr:Putative metal-dependent hydrolase, composite domain superfamily [Colletotrichum destructivum]
MALSNSFLLQDVKIFTGTATIDRGFVHVLNGKIAQVGPGDLPTPLNDTFPVILRPGDTVIPGLIDAHIHAPSGNTSCLEQSLSFGVTTVCDMQNDIETNENLKRLADDPVTKSIYADFKFAGSGALVHGGWPLQVLEKELSNVPCSDHLIDQIVSKWTILSRPEEADPFIRKQVEETGVSYIEMFHEVGDSLGMDLPRPPLDIQKAVVAAAHKYGVIATGHALSYAGAMDLLRAGADGLTHIFLDQPPSDDYIQLMLDNKAHCNPTLGLAASQTDEGLGFQDSFLQDPFAQRLLIQKTAGQPLGLAASQKPRASIHNAYANTRALYKAGVPLVLGTDAAGMGFGFPYGLGMHMEMRLMVKEVGMTPFDVLKSATSVTADRFRFNDRGRIEAGKKADLVLVQGDVFESLAANDGRSLRIKSVWRDGISASVFQDVKAETCDNPF